MDLPEQILVSRPAGYGCSVGVSVPLYKTNAVPLEKSRDGPRFLIVFC
jgi:hypothetical protein